MVYVWDWFSRVTKEHCERVFKDDDDDLDVPLPQCLNYTAEISL